MALPGITEEQEIKLLLKKLLEKPDESFKFAVIARGPKDGELILSKKEKLKKKEVQKEAEQEAQRENGGKPVRLDVIVGECRLQSPGGTVLRLVIYGKTISKAVACCEHLLLLGPYKTLGFTGVIAEEVEEPGDEQPVGGATGAASTTESPSTGSTAPQSATTGAPPPPHPEALRFAQRLKALQPDLAKVASAQGTARAAVDSAQTAAKLAFQSRDFPAAHAALDTLEQAARELLRGLESPTATNDEASRFNERLKQLLPLLKAAAGSPGADAAKLAVSEAGVLARKRDYGAAHALLDKAQSALSGSGPESESASTSATAVPDQGAVTGIPPGVVAKRKFLLERWQHIPPEINADLKQLQQAIERDVPGENAAELMALVEQYLADFYETIQDAIDSAIQTGDADYQSARAAIGEFRKEIPTEPLIEHLRINTMNAPVSVERILLGALAEIEQGLAN